MSEIPKHKIFGISIDEWVSRIPNELAVDAVGLWQITPVFIHDFGLEGNELEKYVGASVSLLIQQGAVPVDGKTWKMREDLCGENGPDLDKIITYCLTLEQEPDFEDVWFSLPGKVAG